MSRYQKTSTLNGKAVQFAWGYDSPLQEYFFQCFKEDYSDDENEVIFSISSVFTLDPHPDFPNKERWSNGELIELMERYKDESGECIIPEKHLQAIALDLPF